MEIDFTGITKEPYDFHSSGKSGRFVVVSRMHNNAIDINNIGRGYNHREHRGTQRIGLTTLRSLCPLWLNPMAFAACVESIRPQQKSPHPQILPQSARRTQRHQKTKARIETVLNSAPSALLRGDTSLDF